MDFSSAGVHEFWDGVADTYDRANDQLRDAHDQRYRETFTSFRQRHRPRSGTSDHAPARQWNSSAPSGWRAR